jgi:hypothetical protein
MNLKHKKMQLLNEGVRLWNIDMLYAPFVLIPNPNNEMHKARPAQQVYLTLT